MTNLLEYNGTSVYCLEIHCKAVPVLFERIFNLEIIAVYNGFYKGKAKAVSAHRARGICLIKLIEDARLILRVNADAVILDRDKNSVLFLPKRERNLAAPLGKFNGIRDQILPNLKKKLLVSVAKGASLVHRNLNLLIAPLLFKKQ